MERKQGFFSALKEEVVRGLSPTRSRRFQSISPLRGFAFARGKRVGTSHSESLVARSGSMRPVGETLTPLIEGPDPEYGESKRTHRADLRLLLGVMGAPLSPLHVNLTDPLLHLSIKNAPIGNSYAHYILHQYIAASGCPKVQNSVKNAYAIGKLKMVASEFESATKLVKHKNSAKFAESGGFVLWQMNPNMWYIELAVGGSKVHAGCNGKIVWRHTPWLGAHTAKGPVRPLRRSLQGLDPRTTACMFADAICIGEKSVNGEDCFVLKLAADPETLKARSEGPAEIIRHVIFGYFSQKTGLLIHIEDSHLTRIRADDGDSSAVYWETSINSYLDDYRPVDGIMIAHSGRSIVTLFRFGEIAMSHSKCKMEETWTIEEAGFNIPGLSIECFIPPADLESSSENEDFELPCPKDKSNQEKVAVLDSNQWQ